MGDKEFENFLGGNTDGEEEQGIHYCQKRLMLDIIQQKMYTLSNLYSSSLEYLSSLKADVETDPLKKRIINIVPKLLDQYKEASNQLDYLFGEVIDEIDGEEEGPDADKPK